MKNYETDLDNLIRVVFENHTPDNSDAYIKKCVGLVMKETRGALDPSPYRVEERARELLKRRLETKTHDGDAPRRSMFNEREAYTQPARDLSDEVSLQMKEWLDRYVEMGFSRREIESVCIAAIGTTTSEEILKAQFAVRHENSR